MNSSKSYQSNIKERKEELKRTVTKQQYNYTKNTMSECQAKIPPSNFSGENMIFNNGGNSNMFNSIINNNNNNMTGNILSNNMNNNSNCLFPNNGNDNANFNYNEVNQKQPGGFAFTQNHYNRSFNPTQNGNGFNNSNNNGY